MFKKFNKRYNRKPSFNFHARPKSKALDNSLLVRKGTDAKTQVQYVAKNQFSNLLISSQLKQNIQEKGYMNPTPIQDQVIPEALNGRDVIGVANTGTGKTGAFLIPLINKAFYNRSQRVLIIAPTRELATQIDEECRAFAKGMGIFTTLAIGGVSMYHQTSALKKRPQFVIGTPGRLKDFERQGKLQLSTFQNTVLDEVDRMMDMGFINDIRFLISKLPKERQSLFFSATIPRESQSLMHIFLSNPITISVKKQDTPEAVEQNIVKINGRNKVDVLHGLLQQEGFTKVLVFGRTKWGMEKLARVLSNRGVRVAAIHGNKSQAQRQRALDQFRHNQIQVLVATDVASRGLDIDEVTHVVNYDQPPSYEDYIHRIGRTGRMNKKGFALTFVE